jgi:hypothetical protein
MPRTVAIILTPDYADAVHPIAFRTPVWMVDTPENRAAAEEAWRRATEWPQISVTLFKVRPEARSDWSNLLDQIGLHERSLDAVEVIGTELTLPARAALTAVGIARFEPTAGGFRARRP